MYSLIVSAQNKDQVWPGINTTPIFLFQYVSRNQITLPFQEWLWKNAKNTFRTATSQATMFHAKVDDQLLTREKRGCNNKGFLISLFPYFLFSANGDPVSSVDKQIHSSHCCGDHQPKLAEIVPHATEPVLGLSGVVAATSPQFRHQYGKNRFPAEHRIAWQRSGTAFLRTIGTIRNVRGSAWGAKQGLWSKVWWFKGAEVRIMGVLFYNTHFVDATILCPTSFPAHPRE